MKKMQKATIKKQILTITLILTLVTTATLVVSPIVSGQPNLIMNCGTQAILNFPFDVDLNGPTSQWEGIKFAYKAPGATEFILTTGPVVDNEPGLPGERYVTDLNGDLDIDVTFNQTGAFQVKWVHPATGAESGVTTVNVVSEIVCGTYMHINVGPNPVGVNQQVTVNMFAAIPTYTSEGYRDMTVTVTDPQGQETELGPFVTDTTGGTYAIFTPNQVGIWEFQAIYPGQTLTSGVTQLPDDSEIFYLTVQEDPVTREGFPTPPGPENYWDLPVNAMNAENWYWHTGEWWGLGTAVTFEQTGGNVNGMYNPYTDSVNSAHVLWTKPWGAGGVAGGESGPDQITGHFWTTRQYQPQYAPVIMEGIMYANYYTTEEARPGHNGIMATDLFTGETLWIIDTYERLRCGYSPTWHNLNEYGTIGPYIITTGDHPGVDTAGTTYNIYDGVTGKYIASIINGHGMDLTLDDDRDIIGFYLDNVEVDNTTERHLVRWDMTECLRTTTNGNPAFGWNLRQDYEFDFHRGDVWSEKVPDWTEIQGATGPDSLSVDAITNDDVVMTASGRRSDPWNFVVVMDKNNGELLWARNISSLETDAFLPYTRTETEINDGMYIIANMENYKVQAYSTRTGAKVWNTELRGDNGALPHWYDLFNFHMSPGPGVSFFYGFGGDVWCLENTDGSIRWYTNTTKLVGAPGAENPYGIWPLWTFNCEAITNNVIYLNIGHEYNPPMFPGAQMCAINITDGSLVFSYLGMFIRSTAVAYDILLSLNAYDNQIHALGRGPSSTTVKAPDYGVTLGTPVTITGTVMDISAGTEQNEQAKRFPNGLPCISDEDMSHFMEHVYQEQTLDYEVSGVEVVITTIDPNNNWYELGRTTTTSSGVFGLAVEPPVPGLYRIIATFDTTNSYWGSSAETYMYVGETAPTTPIEPEPPTPEPPTEPEPEAPLITTEVAIIIAVAVAVVIGVAAYWALRRRQ
jgi:hypothetical protein